MIISLSGIKRSGKDVVGNYFVRHHGFTRLAFADSLKELCANTLKLPLRDFHHNDFKDVPFFKPIEFDKSLAAELSFHLNELGYDVIPGECFYSHLGTKILSPRHALTFIGTDLCRNHVDQNIWLNITLRIAKEAQGGLVITDSRFNNERDGLKALGAVTAIVQREEALKAYNGDLAHISESEQLSYPYDVVINNNSTILSLESDLSMWYTLRKNSLY